MSLLADYDMPVSVQEARLVVIVVASLPRKYIKCDQGVLLIDGWQLRCKIPWFQLLFRVQVSGVCKSTRLWKPRGELGGSCISRKTKCR